MTHDNLDQIWASENATGPTSTEALKRVTAAALRVRRRARILVLAGVQLSLATILAVWALSTNRASVASSWPALLCLLLLWSVYAEFLRVRRQQKALDSKIGSTSRELVEKALRYATLHCRDLGLLIGANLFVAIPLSAVSYFQLVAQEKLQPHQASSFAVFTGVILGIQLLTLLVYRTKRAIPQRNQLAACLESLTSKAT